MKKLIVFLFIGLFISCSANEKIYKNHKWEFLKEKLVSVPKFKASNVGVFSLKFLGAGFASILSFYTVNYLLGRFLNGRMQTDHTQYATTDEVYNEKLINFITQKICIGSALLASILAFDKTFKLVYKNISKQTLAKLECNELRKFIQNWPNYKASTPEECAYIFEELYSDYKMMLAVPNDKLEESSRLLKSMIEVYFKSANRT